MATNCCSVEARNYAQCISPLVFCYSLAQSFNNKMNFLICFFPREPNGCPMGFNHKLIKQSN